MDTRWPLSTFNWPTRNFVIPELATNAPPTDRRKVVDAGAFNVVCKSKSWQASALVILRQDYF